MSTVDYLPGPGASGLLQNYPIKFSDVSSPAAQKMERQRGPITTGSSIVAAKFSDGVIIAADNLVSYGSMAKYQNIKRVRKIHDNIIIGFTGEYADFQELMKLIEQKTRSDQINADKITLKPKQLYTWLSCDLYRRRCNFTPLWLDLVVGGMQDDETPFLGHISQLGRAYEDDFIATGMGSHMALPILREFEEKRNELTEVKAKELVKSCMEVLYYRDCRATAKYTILSSTKRENVFKVEQENLSAQQNWNVASFVSGYN